MCCRCANVLVTYHRTIIFHFLAPNPESTSAFEEMERQGVCHALLDWNLYRKRANRSSNSRAGGLWYWFDMTMTKWIEQVFPQQSQSAIHDHATPSLVENLRGNGWLSPMDFAWSWRRLPEPDDLPMFQLANRGIFIYECHRARSCIQEEASRTLQMFARRVLIEFKRFKKSQVIGTQQFCHGRSAHEENFSEDVHTRLAKDTWFEQQVARDVLLCIEDMVDDLVICHRQEQKIYENEVRQQESPVRTEQRQKIISELEGAVQTDVRTNEATQIST